MELDSVRELKAEVTAEVVAELTRRTGPTSLAQRGRAAAHDGPTTVAVGVLPRPRGFGLAVRVSSTGALQLPALDELLTKWEAETDVRVVGRVRAAALAGGRAQARGGRAWDASGTATAAGRRDRPLRPGTSVAHPDVSAGTLGAFVRDADGRVLLLSNNHVLADTDRAQLGDPVLSPGPADGGRPEVDRVATLDAFERLASTGNRLDLALAAVDDPALVGGNVVPEGSLAGVLDDVLDGVEVAKVGRTTGHTTGVVTVVELDGVTVDYGDGRTFSFDDCLEVEGDGRAFSDGGDSGSIVYARDGLHAVGLLFAGSTTGGAGGTGLTFCNPAATALRTAAVTLL